MESKHPELYQFLDEMPGTIPKESNPLIDEKILEDYYHSLNELVHDYELYQPLATLSIEGLISKPNRYIL